MGKCNTYGNIKAVYLIKNSDYISDEKGMIVRMKRKYGKFDRKIIELIK